MSTPSTRRSVPVLWLVAAVVLAAGAAWLRLRQLGFTEMGSDQARTLGIALAWVQGGPLPLTSIASSFGPMNAPFIEYLYAIPLAVQPDPLSVVWLTALLDLAGVLVAGLATARAFGPRTAWWATLMYAVNPWAVYYGQLIWMQTVVPFFAAVVYACALLYFTVDSRPRYLAIGGLALALTIQTHPTAAVLLPVLLLMLLVQRRDLKLAGVAAGVALFVLAWTPYLAYLVQTQSATLQQLRDGLAAPAQTSLASVLIALDLLQTKGIFSTLAPADALWRGQDPWWLVGDGVVAILLGLAVAGTAVALLARISQRAPARAGAPVAPAPLSPQDAGRLLLLLWFVVPLLVFVRHNQYLQNYYFLYLFPVPFVLMADGVDRLHRALARRAPARVVRWAAGLVFVPLALVALTQAFTDVVGQDLRAAGVSGRARVVDMSRAIDHARTLSASRPECALVVLSDGARYESSRFALFRQFVRAAPVRFVEAGAAYLLPTRCALYFAAAPGPGVVSWLAATAEPLVEYAVHTPAETWTFHDLPAARRQEVVAGLPAAAPLAQWANGIRLLEAAIGPTAPPGGTLAVSTTWQVVEAPGPGDREVHFGNYLLDQANGVVSQMDGVGVDSLEWRAGDLFLTRFALPLPPALAPGTYRVALKLYRYPEIVPIPLDASGQTLLVLDRLPVTVP